MKRKKKKAEEEAGKRDLFIVGYTALSLILLAFFICIDSMATLTEKRVQKGMYSVKSAFGVLPGESTKIIGNKLIPIENFSLEGIDLETVRSLLEVIKSLNLTNDDISLGVTKRGLVLSLKGDLLFAPGSVDLKPGSYPILDQAAKLIASCPNKIRIEGHSDNIPIKNKRFSSNFELSAARALSVLEYFTRIKGLPAGRFYAVGCGEYRPLFPNDTKEHRAKNRRVWIIFEGTPRWSRLNRIDIHGFTFKIKEFLR